MILLYNTIFAENILTNQPKIFVTFSAPVGGNLAVSSDVITTKILAAPLLRLSDVKFPQQGGGGGGGGEGS